MQLPIIMKINEDPLQKKFLREYSYWYKYLNRDVRYYKDFLVDMKEKYKLTMNDKINKVINNINMFKSFLDVLK